MSVLPTTTTRGLAPSRQVLANGLTVISKHTPVTPAVTINASIRAGSVCDPPDGAGLAHFLSKTIDRGTMTRSADQIAEELDSRGVSLATSVTRQYVSCRLLPSGRNSAHEPGGSFSTPSIAQRCSGSQ